ncbi:MAG: LptF/LptG family permease, partial [Elusimicrobiaceae bacterium]|nr:LptF/LptG family permease [Elusimicrobiaceae bacterium]
MSIIGKYISKNFLTMFTGILFVLVFVIFMGQFSRIYSYAMQYGANLFWVMSMMVYLLPDILVLSLPI